MNKDLSKETYLLLNEELIPKGVHLLPFKLFLSNKRENGHKLLSSPNIPFDKENISLQKEQSYSILETEKNSFCNFFKINPWDVPQIVEQLSEDELDLLPLYKLKSEFKTALDENKFSKFISKVREHLLIILPQNDSIEISFCRKLVETNLTSDNKISIQVAISSLIFILSKYESMKDLSTLIFATYFHHAGLTQIPYELTQINSLELSKKEKKIFNKHLYLSVHLLKKLDIPIYFSDVSKIINQHHERFNGKGYPQGLKEDKIDPLSLILGFSSHLMDYSSGFINGKKCTIKHTILLIKSKTNHDGLEYDFGSIIKEIIKDF